MSARYVLEPLQRVRQVERERAQHALARLVAMRARAAQRVVQLARALEVHAGSPPAPPADALAGAALRRAAAFAQRHADHARALRAKLSAAQAEQHALDAQLEAARREVERTAGAEQVLERDRERFERSAARQREHAEQRELDERPASTRPARRSP